MRKLRELHNFYKSKQWYIARTVKTQNANVRCGRIEVEVHHKIKLTVDNVKDDSISLNQDNLELLCKNCHNEEDGRFTKKDNMFDEDGNYLG